METIVLVLLSSLIAYSIGRRNPSVRTIKKIEAPLKAKTSQWFYYGFNAGCEFGKQEAARNASFPNSN